VTQAGRIRIANAPVSFGAFELTAGTMPGVPDGDTVLEEVAAAGYEGIDLGPLGFLGNRDDLRARLARHRLSLSGGYLELPFSDPVKMPAALRELDSLLDAFDAVEQRADPKPKPTLADAGSDLRRERPGQAAHDRSLGFSDDQWRRFAEGVAMAVASCRQRGYEATFHHHAGTHVEAAWEIEKVLETTPIGLCLDTGHLLVGGGDPVKALNDWGLRINHLHLKDARRAVVDQIVHEAAPVAEIWRRRAFCRLGEGDLDVEAVLTGLRDSYAGWIVVEQDVLPEAAGTAAEDQRANRRYLAERGF
jgi:inosose dehydratase